MTLSKTDRLNSRYQFVSKNSRSKLVRVFELGKGRESWPTMQKTHTCHSRQRTVLL